MKSAFLCLSLCLSLPAFAGTNIVGDFAFPHKVGFAGGYEEEGCQADNGEWQNGVCLIDAEDTVSVTPDVGGFFNAQVSTISFKGQLCDFQGVGQRTSDNVLVVSAPNLDSSPGKNGGGGNKAPELCELTLTFQDNNTVSVRSRDPLKCSSFCGANASLDIERAVRK